MPDRPPIPVSSEYAAHNEGPSLRNIFLSSFSLCKNTCYFILNNAIFIIVDMNSIGHAQQPQNVTSLVLTHLYWTYSSLSWIKQDNSSMRNWAPCLCSVSIVLKTAYPSFETCKGKHVMGDDCLVLSDEVKKMFKNKITIAAVYYKQCPTTTQFKLQSWDMSCALFSGLPCSHQNKISCVFPVFLAFSLYFKSTKK